MSEFGDTIPYTVGNNTIDLSAQLEKQLNDQMSDDPLDMQEEPCAPSSPGGWIPVW